MDTTNTSPRICVCGEEINGSTATGVWCDTDGFSNCNIKDEFGIRAIPHEPSEDN